MKTERRHELQENDLANWLGEKIVKIQPYSKTMLGLLVLAMVAFMVTVYVRGRNERARQVGWASYFDALTTSDVGALEDVAERYPGTNAAAWALLRAGDLRLEQAIQQMFQNREEAQRELLAARDIYESTLELSRDPMVLQRANYGLAKCLESQGEFEEARKRYEQIQAQWPASEFATMADERLAQLERPATREWYSWFAQQKPVVSPLTDPSLFQDLPNLPESPDLQIPNPGQLLEPSSPSASDDAADLDLDLDAPATDPTVPTTVPSPE